MNSKTIIQYCDTNYPDEAKLIARSMMNYYHIKNKKDLSIAEETHKNQIYKCVIDLFWELARRLSDELNLDETELFNTLFKIHVKT